MVKSVIRRSGAGATVEPGQCARTMRNLVLLLGRFRGRQKRVLKDVLTPTLRELGYVPMVFDFSPPANRELIRKLKKEIVPAAHLVTELQRRKRVAATTGSVVGAPRRDRRH